MLELTEHNRIEDYEVLLAALDRFRWRGVRLAVDDTGAGYAGFQHLVLPLPAHVLSDLTPPEE